ncbi:MAG: hypothetical protein IJ608_14985 [Lachnospiraceae bacterium]|nr:hypothetical protein [Lachnospiraceae bacterium]
MRYLQRPELMREQDPLPDHYWEPQPDEKDIAEYNARLKEEYERKVAAGEIEEEELPFV